MTALELYKFIHNSNIECRWDFNDNKRDVIVFIPIWEMTDFSKLLSKYSFDDGGIECRFLDKYFAFWMKDICEYFDIDLVDIFGEDKK